MNISILPSWKGRLKAAVALLIGIMLTFSIGLAQEIGNIAGLNPEIGLKKATEDFRNRDYKSALELFSQLKISFPDDSRFSIFCFMHARTQLKLDRLVLAENELEDFVEVFQGSKYIGYAILLLGDIRFQQDDYFGAAYYYIQSHDRLKGKELRDKAHNSLINIISSHISLSRLDDLADRALNYDLSAEMLFEKARRESRMNKPNKAAYTISRLKEKFPNSEFAKRAERIEDRIVSDKDGSFLVGVLAPLSGRMSSYGIEMLRGIKLALEDFKKQNPTFDAKLEIYDNFGKQQQTITGIEELETLGADVIIGPLKSENAFSAAAVSKESNIPLIIPVAGADGIASVSDNIFQLTPNSEYIAQKMAEYAYNNLFIEQCAVISPNDDYGEGVSAAFTETFTKLGGEVPQIAFYQHGIVDFRRPLTEIKDVLTDGLDTLIEQGLVDSSLYFSSKRPDELLPKYEWPVVLDGLFIPGYADEIALIAPQVVFGQMSTTLLGNEGWSDPEVLKSAKGYLNGAVFTTDFFLFEDDPHWVEYSKKFQKHYAVNPTHVAGLSYDAATIALTAAQDPSKKSIKRYIADIKGFRGVSGNITFKGGDGVNREVVYCKVVDSQVERQTKSTYRKTNGEENGRGE
ncbi:MAG: ABC transporter substrate-binding protein [candidate division Zixibacteria bacterium]|nr:ABC transporter substrate-binding protein [candidate division Zixibacteria bacterium]